MRYVCMCVKNMKAVRLYLICDISVKKEETESGLSIIQSNFPIDQIKN